MSRCSFAKRHPKRCPRDNVSSLVTVKTAFSVCLPFFFSFSRCLGLPCVPSPLPHLARRGACDALCLLGVSCGSTIYLDVKGDGGGGEPLEKVLEGDTASHVMSCHTMAAQNEAGRAPHCSSFHLNHLSIVHTEFACREVLRTGRSLVVRNRPPLRGLLNR